MFFGVALTIFCALMWTSKNEILRALAITGAVTIFSSWIGLVGCSKAIAGVDVIRPTLVKEFPGQGLLLFYLYMSFIIFCLFLYESTWCLLYQEETANYIARQSFHIDIDFKDLSIEKLTTKQNIRAVILIAGTIAILGAVAAITVIQKSIKIAWTHTTLNTSLQVQSLAMLLLAAALMDGGREVAPLFDLVTLVQYNQA